MKPIGFEEANLIFGANQPEYNQLPILHKQDGDVVSCWELSEEEIKQITETKKLWISVKTFNNPLQPIFCTVIKDDVL